MALCGPRRFGVVADHDLQEVGHLPVRLNVAVHVAGDPALVVHQLGLARGGLLLGHDAAGATGTVAAVADELGLTVQLTDAAHGLHDLGVADLVLQALDLLGGEAEGRRAALGDGEVDGLVLPPVLVERRVLFRQLGGAFGGLGGSAALDVLDELGGELGDGGLRDACFKGGLAEPVAELRPGFGAIGELQLGELVAGRGVGNADLGAEGAKPRLVGGVLREVNHAVGGDTDELLGLAMRGDGGERHFVGGLVVPALVLDMADQLGVRALVPRVRATTRAAVACSAARATAGPTVTSAASRATAGPTIAALGGEGNHAATGHQIEYAHVQFSLSPRSAGLS